MALSFGKDNGAIIGLVRHESNDVVDVSEALDGTSAEEALVCLNEEGEKIVYVAKLCADTGNLLWVTDEQRNVAWVMNRTVSMSQMKSMLADRDRNSIYELAIAKIIAHFKENNGRMPRFIDIGCGTGLLSMFCVKHGAKSVVGVEMFDEMAQIAAEVVQINNFEDKIQIVNAKSTELDLDQMEPDIIVSELLDSALLGESCIYSHGDIVERYLKHNPRVEDCVIPHSALIYATLIHCDSVKSMCNVSSIPLFATNNVSPYRDEDAAACSGGWSLVPIHWSSYKSKNGCALSAATVVADIPFHLAGSAEDFGVGTFETTIEVTDSNSVDGILLHWKLFLLSPEIDPERKVFYSTESNAMNWQDHWLQVVYPLPQSLDCQVGDQIKLTLKHDLINVSVKAAKVCSTPRDADVSVMKRMKVEAEDDDGADSSQCGCGWHLLYGPDRLQLLNDSNYNHLWNQSLDSLVAQLAAAEASAHDKLPIILDLSDGSLNAHALVPKLRANKVTSLKVVSRETKLLGNMFHSQLVTANSAEDMLYIWDDEEICDILEYFGDSTELKSNILIKALISECFYYQLHALPAWNAISFLYQRSHYDYALDRDALIVPSKAYVMAIAIELVDLQVSHGTIGSVDAFDHSPFDRRLECWSDHLFPYKLGLYRKKFLTQPFLLYEISYASSDVSSNFGSKSDTISIIESGRCDCVAIWIDYNLTPARVGGTDATGEKDLQLKHLNTNLHDFELHYKQNLKFFAEPVNVAAKQQLVSTCTFQQGASDFQYSFQIH